MEVFFFFFFPSRHNKPTYKINVYYQKAYMPKSDHKYKTQQIGK